MNAPKQSSMREVLVIRHASTRLNNDDAAIDRLRGWSDIPLSLQGMEQAKTLAEEVASSPPDVILCSDLNRCVVTARIISERLGIRLEEPAFNLRPWNVGVFTGRKALEVLPLMMSYVTEHPDRPLPEGESFNTFRNRFVQGSARCADAAQGPSLHRHPQPFRAPTPLTGGRRLERSHRR